MSQWFYLAGSLCFLIGTMLNLPVSPAYRATVLMMLIALVITTIVISVIDTR